LRLGASKRKGCRLSPLPLKQFFPHFGLIFGVFSISPFFALRETLLVLEPLNSFFGACVHGVLLWCFPAPSFFSSFFHFRNLWGYFPLYLGVSPGNFNFYTPFIPLEIFSPGSKKLSPLRGIYLYPHVGQQRGVQPRGPISRRSSTGWGSPPFFSREFQGQGPRGYKLGG